MVPQRFGYQVFSLPALHALLLKDQMFQAPDVCPVITLSAQKPPQTSSRADMAPSIVNKKVRKINFIFVSMSTGLKKKLFQFFKNYFFLFSY